MLRLVTAALVGTLLLLSPAAGQETAAPPPPADGAPAAAPPAHDQPASAPRPAYTPRSADDKARSEAEFTAIAYLKTVMANEKEYKKKFEKYSPTLLALAGGGRSFTKRMARPDRGDYTVEYRANKDRDKFSITLTPKEYDPTLRAFFMDDSGKIRAQEGQPATVASELLH